MLAQPTDSGSDSAPFLFWEPGQISNEIFVSSVEQKITPILRASMRTKYDVTYTVFDKECPCSKW